MATMVRTASFSACISSPVLIEGKGIVRSPAATASATCLIFTVATATLRLKLTAMMIIVTTLTPMPMILTRLLVAPAFLALPIHCWLALSMNSPQAAIRLSALASSCWAPAASLAMAASVWPTCVMATTSSTRSL